MSQSQAGGSAESGAVDVLAQQIGVEYGFILYYNRLVPLMPDAECRELVRRLGTESLRHAGILGNIVGRLGGGLVLPEDEPLPHQSQLLPLFQRQLERENEALALARRAVGLVPPQYRALVQEIADQEIEHIGAVGQVLARLSAAG